MFRGHNCFAAPLPQCKPISTERCLEVTAAMTSGFEIAGMTLTLGQTQSVHSTAPLRNHHVLPCCSGSANKACSECCLEVAVH